MEANGMGNIRRNYQYIEIFGLRDDKNEDKIGMINKGKQLIAHSVIHETVNEYLRKRREKKLDKILQNICNNVNNLPRGFGTLPENKNISFNGYFNFKYPDLPGSGNDDRTNAELYFNEYQIIEDEFYKYKKEIIKLCGDDPELREKVAEVYNDLHERNSCYRILRNDGTQESVVKRTIELDIKYGAKYQNNFLFNKAANLGLNILNQAEEELEKKLTPREREVLNKYIEQLKVYFVKNGVSLKKVDEVDSRTDFARRVQDFVGNYGEGHQQRAPLAKQLRSAKNNHENSVEKSEEKREKFDRSEIQL